MIQGHYLLRVGIAHCQNDDWSLEPFAELREQILTIDIVAQGIGSSSVTTKGFGKSQPIASNDTAAGRQQNRRVELVVAGETIGTNAAATTTRTNP